MKKIKPEDLPLKLTSEIIEILVGMAREFPKTDFSWRDVSNLLQERGQLDIILSEIRRTESAERQKLEESKTPEQREKEKKALEESYKNIDYTQFHGNMGQPETITEYKYRYGTWPPGYDERVNPYKLPEVLDEDQVTIIARLYLNREAPQYWSEIISQLKNKSQLERVFNKVAEINMGVFPLHKVSGIYQKIDAKTFHAVYGVWPPGFDQGEMQ